MRRDPRPVAPRYVRDVPEIAICNPSRARDSNRARRAKKRFRSRSIVAESSRRSAVRTGRFGAFLLSAKRDSLLNHVTQRSHFSEQTTLNVLMRNRISVRPPRNAHFRPRKSRARAYHHISCAITIQTSMTKLARRAHIRSLARSL